MSVEEQILPSLFIGSSKEGLDIARAVELNLGDGAEITIWSNGVFGLNEGYLESLVNALERFDFAALVLTPDDLVSSRDTISQAPRDNVMFELGLFMGRLGRNRTFVVCSDQSNIKMTSDLAGVHIHKYRENRSDHNKSAAVSPVCTLIRNRIRELGLSENRFVRRLTSATHRFEGLSDQVSRIIYLMARSRILELEHVSSQFGGLLGSDFTQKLLQDIKLLKDETEPSVWPTPK
jgi:hypothetical protein